MQNKIKFIHRWGIQRMGFVFLFPLFSLAFNLDSDSTQYYFPIMDYLNVYQGAGYESRVIGQLMQTDLISVCTTKDGWSNIVLSGNPNTGYVVSKFLTKSDYSSGKLNKNDLFSSGIGEFYRTGMWYYQSTFKKHMVSITILGVIISILMGIFLFVFFRKGKAPDQGKINDNIGNLPFNVKSSPVIACFILIAISEATFTGLITQIVIPISIFSFGIEFTLIVTLFLWMSGVVLIPVRLPVLMERLGYRWIF